MVDKILENIDDILHQIDRLKLGMTEALEVHKVMIKELTDDNIRMRKELGEWDDTPS